MQIILKCKDCGHEIGELNRRDMSIEYIRDCYEVPAQKGGRVEYTDTSGRKYQGTIQSADGHYLTILLDGSSQAYRFHPTWNIKYLTDKNLDTNLDN